MKRVNYMIVLSILLVLVQASPLGAFRLKETWIRTFDVEEGAEFVLKNVNGFIGVEGWDREDVRVLAEIRIKAPSKSKAKRLLGELEFDVLYEPRRLVIEADLPRIRQDAFGIGRSGHTAVTIRYTVRIPRGTSLDLETVNGDIGAAGFAGDFRLYAASGSIELRSTGGSGTARTSNGGIDCIMENFPFDGELSLKAVNGGIELVLPEDSGAVFDAKALNGRIRVGRSLRDRIDIKRITAEGVLGGGEGRISLETKAGDITIKAL